MKNSIYKYAQKKFYPRDGVHEVENWCYVRQIVRAVLKGEDVPPYIISFSGTHRAAANHLLEALGKPERIETFDLEKLTPQQSEFFGYLVNEDEDYLADLYITRIAGYDAYQSSLDNTMRSEGKDGGVSFKVAGYIAQGNIDSLDTALKTFLADNKGSDEDEIFKISNKKPKEV